jgi:putative membrane protein
MMDGYWGSWFGMGIWWIVLLGIVVAAVWAGSRRREPPVGSESALDVLKKRYARGEINRDEYEQMKRVLSD